MLEESGVVDILYIQGYETSSQANVRVLRRGRHARGVDDCSH